MSLVVVAVMLAMPGAALADGSVSYSAPTTTITYADVGNTVDNVIVDDVQDIMNGGVPAYAFQPQGGATVNGVAPECSTQAGWGICPREATRFVFNLAGGNDVISISDFSVTPVQNRPAVMNGGAGNDTLSGSHIVGDTLNGDEGADTLHGLTGNDVLTGGPGPDVFDGDTDNDTINAFDREVDTSIDCGMGDDTVNVDWNDPVPNANCEDVNRADRDDDQDGSAHGVDCNDSNARIRPGAIEIPNNGIDEDCRLGDLRVDRDGDGTLSPSDCDDTDPTRYPGARERRQNGVDENCDGRDAPFIRRQGRISTNWQSFTAYTQLLSMTFRDIPTGGRVVVRCKTRSKGCPFAKRRLTVRRHRASATRLFRGAQLEPGAVVEVRITDAETIGNVVRYTIRSHALPKRRQLCLPPGKTRPGRC